MGPKGLGAVPFGTLAMKAVGCAAGSVVEEGRRHFGEIAGVLERATRPDYSTAVDLLTRTAIKGMVLPSLLPALVVSVRPSRDGGAEAATPATQGIYVSANRSVMRASRASRATMAQLTWPVDSASAVTLAPA